MASATFSSSRLCARLAAGARGRGRRAWRSLIVETHDCFTIAELIEYEPWGWCRKGRGAKMHQGRPDRDKRRLPVNPSVGSRPKATRSGATGVSMHALAAMQLTGTAGDFQSRTRGSRASSTWAVRRSPLCEHPGAHSVVALGRGAG